MGALLEEVGPLVGRRTLDVGCGTGRWSRVLAARGADVLGVDRSESMLAEARCRGSTEFRAMNATRLDLPDDMFELATAVTVIQHLEPRGQEVAVGELVRVVRAGGFVLTIDRIGRGNSFSSAHGTFPRPREEWHELWNAAGAKLVLARGQEFSYPLALARIGRGRATAGTYIATGRRGGTGWRRVVLNGLVAASYATEVLAERFQRAPAQHIAALYVVR